MFLGRSPWVDIRQLVTTNTNVRWKKLSTCVIHEGGHQNTIIGTKRTSRRLWQSIQHYLFMTQQSKIYRHLFVKVLIGTDISINALFDGYFEIDLYNIEEFDTHNRSQVLSWHCWMRFSQQTWITFRIIQIVMMVLNHNDKNGHDSVKSEFQWKKHDPESERWLEYDTEFGRYLIWEDTVVDKSGPFFHSVVVVPNEVDGTWSL